MTAQYFLATKQHGCSPRFGWEVRGVVLVAWMLCVVFMVSGAVLGGAGGGGGSAMPPALYADQQLVDPRQESQARALMVTLRCPVCQGQSIADSDAPLAGDMRHHVRLKIADGQSAEQIRAWLVARYGRWVSYDPPFDSLTAPLWYGPLVFLVIAVAIAARLFRKRLCDAEGMDNAEEGEKTRENMVARNMATADENPSPALAVSTADSPKDIA